MKHLIISCILGVISIIVFVSTYFILQGEAYWLFVGLYGYFIRPLLWIGLLIHTIFFFIVKDSKAKQLELIGIVVLSLVCIVLALCVMQKSGLNRENFDFSIFLESLLPID